MINEVLPSNSLAKNDERSIAFSVNSHGIKLKNLPILKDPEKYGTYLQISPSSCRIAPDENDFDILTIKQIYFEQYSFNACFCAHA